MPSSHSQFMFFFSTYTIFFLLKRLKSKSNVLMTSANVNFVISRTIEMIFCWFSFFYFFRLHHNSPLEKIFRALAIVICLVVTLLICYGRVYLLYHTVNQVIVGAIVGTVAGTLYFLFVHLVLTPFVFPRIVTWKISELLLIRDTSLIPNILFFEYTRTRQECLARSRKNKKMQ